MRLIDADALEEEVANFFLAITGNPKQATVVRECKKSFQQMIEEQPTAYDVDKVVEPLEKCAAIMTSGVDYDCFQDGSCQYGDCMVCVFKKAIETVKRGGVIDGD